MEVLAHLDRSCVSSRLRISALEKSGLSIAECFGEETRRRNDDTA
jgi:hypothetical protein